VILGSSNKKIFAHDFVFDLVQSFKEGLIRFSVSKEAVVVMAWYKLATTRIIVVILGFEKNRGDAKDKEGCKNLKA
jgi:hypothetical protein